MDSLRPALREKRPAGGPQRLTWLLWERWLSEILADFWSVARVGITAPLGLMSVLSLPRAFVFRVSLDDPHPIPWIRLKLSCAMGDALYPHPQWARLAAIWEAANPLDGLDRMRGQLLRSQEAGIRDFVSLLVHHRPEHLRGKSLGEALSLADRQPENLQATYHRWRRMPVEKMSRSAPCLAFAMIGQARVDGVLSPATESRLLIDLLTRWAVRGTLDASFLCARPAKQPGLAQVV
jgi:hypothetical protein